ncbi:MAG TPA: bacillithiol biosynthesis deacetylase BshB1 [Chitinophagales bacterium]|nr:bacillithiol biosynthesis deacetylase BshB1 [Chitinophagales bacterium]
MKVDILALGAHPDDVEISCSATLLKHISLGKKVAVVDLTQGELGTRGSAEERLIEAANSAKLMGLVDRVNLGFRDGFFTHDETHLLAIVRMIRKYQPEIVLANSVSDRHPDHGKAGKLIADACFLSGLKKIETSLDSQVQTHWRPKSVYHYIQDYYLKPDFVIDVSGFEQKKIEAIKTFKTQFFDPASTDPKTPISGEDFFDFLLGRMKDFGRPIGAEYAEGFTTSRHIGIRQFDDLM